MATIKIVGSVEGFVNYVTAGRFVVGNSYKKKDTGETVLLGSTTVFVGENFKGEIPAKGTKVRVSGTLNIGPNKVKAEELSATLNLNRDQDLVVIPTGARAAADAPAAAGDDDI